MTRVATQKLAVIGAGNMAEALVNGIVRAGLLPAAQVAVADVLAERVRLFEQKFGIAPCAGNAAAAREADICLLAVKPQQIRAVVGELAGDLPPRCLVISIAAGITTAVLEGLLPGGQRVVRVMPNTPCLVGKGVSAVCAGSRSTAEDLETAKALLQSVGKVFMVTENLMDAVTAVSGSGPAYLFYLVESMNAAAEQLGLGGSLGRDMVAGTVEGAIRLLIETGLPPDELRRRVTSKGGTTEAAIGHLTERTVQQSIIEAIAKASQRSRELSGPATR